MQKILIAALATAAFAISAPASAGITNQSASASQGTLVHGTGTEQNAYDIIANLGAGGPNVVHFNGNTTETPAASDLLHLQGGQGQADVTGAVISGNSTYPIYSMDVYLTGHGGMTWIEFALTGTNNNSPSYIDFALTDSLGGPLQTFHLLLGSGDTHYGFGVTGASTITNVHWSTDPTTATVDLIKQVRIMAAPGAVPEPGTWALMLLGFGGIGLATRRARKASGKLLQVA
jgi:hypothetical protein